MSSTRMIRKIVLVLVTVSIKHVCGWMPSPCQYYPKPFTTAARSSLPVDTVCAASTNCDQDSMLPQQQQHNNNNQATRRELLSKSGAVVVALNTVVLTSTITPETAVADTASSSSQNKILPEEISRMQIGYKQICYLLDHFEEETTVCRENGGECKRDANAIRKVLGLRSTTDPLFQIEKVFAKFKNLNLDSDVDIGALYDAAEDWNSSIAMSNSMAFISQFGEYNPGGGKDEVLKYLLESKKQVFFAKEALQTIMVNLKIPLSKE